MDISGGGALISSEVRMNVGERARLNLLLNGAPFSAWVEVTRASEGTRSGGRVRHHLAVVFLAVDERSQQVLNRFRGDTGQPSPE